MNTYLEETSSYEIVSSDFEDSGRSDCEPFKKYDNIVSYDMDDEENNHLNTPKTSHNNFINTKCNS